MPAFKAWVGVSLAFPPAPLSLSVSLTKFKILFSQVHFTHSIHSFIFILSLSLFPPPLSFTLLPLLLHFSRPHFHPLLPGTPTTGMLPAVSLVQLPAPATLLVAVGCVSMETLLYDASAPIPPNNAVPSAGVLALFHALFPPNGGKWPRRGPLRLDTTTIPGAPSPHLLLGYSFLPPPPPL